MTWDEACDLPTPLIRKLGAMGLLGVIFHQSTAELAWDMSTMYSPSKSYQPSMVPSG